MLHNRLNMKKVMFIFSIPVLLIAPMIHAAELSVDDCVRMALERSDQIKISEAELAYYRGQYHEALWNFWLPHVSATFIGGGPVAKQDKVITRVTDVSNLGAMGLGPGFVIQGSIDFVYPLYTFGKLGSLLDAAGSGVDAAAISIVATKNSVIMDTRKAFYGMVLAGEIISIMEDGKDRLDSARKKMQEMLDNDDPSATEKDLYRIDYYASEIISKLEEAKKGKAMAEAALRLLIGLDQNEALSIQRTNLEDNLSTIKPMDDYLRDSSASRPDLKALSHAIEARASLAKARSRAYYPDFFIGGGFRFGYTNVDYEVVSPLLRDDLNYMGGGAGLGLRLDLDIGTKYAQEEQAKAELLKIRMQSRLAEKAAQVQVKKAYLDYTQSRTTYLSYRNGEKAAKKWLVSTTMNYNVGLGDTKDLLDALIAHAQAKIQLLKSAYDARAAMAELTMATGTEKF